MIAQPRDDRSRAHHIDVELPWSLGNSRSLRLMLEGVGRIFTTLPFPLVMPVGTLSIADLLRPEFIRLGLEGGTKQEVVDHLITVLDGAPEVLNLESARTDVWAREEQMSTGIGNNLALPHARSGAVRGTVLAFATMAEPIEFGSIDGEPVRLVFLMLGPKGAVDRHVRLLGRISRIMAVQQLRQRLLEATHPDEVLRILGEAEETLEG